MAAGTESIRMPCSRPSVRLASKGKSKWHINLSYINLSEPIQSWAAWAIWKKPPSERLLSRTFPGIFWINSQDPWEGSVSLWTKFRPQSNPQMFKYTELILTFFLFLALAYRYKKGAVTSSLTDISNVIAALNTNKHSLLSHGILK